MEEREEPRGDLTHQYSIPSARVDHKGLSWRYLVIPLALLGLYHRVVLSFAFHAYWPLMAVLGMLFMLGLLQYFLGLAEREPLVSPDQQEQLDALRVVVNVPCYNEDPVLVDRTLYGLFHSSRLPDVVDVVDDGSSVDYRSVRDYWQNHHPAGTTFTWQRQENRGKKWAQAATFSRLDGDIFVTIDSDTALERHALREGLKPFIHPDVQSVAGLELAYNFKRNFITRLNGTRSLVWQLIVCSAQSILGDLLVNRGTFALYRADLIRDNLDNYVNERFFGHPMHLGDDAALTLFAQCRGRAVQCSSAVQFAVYPERLDHHLRQWLRWMRGLTARTFWRIRYLPIKSYSWWYTVINFWLFLSTSAVLALMAIFWPLSLPYALTTFVFGSIWSLVAGMRVFSVNRSDESHWTRLGQVLLYPLAVIWVLLVLRPLRFVGIATCLKKGWGTRQKVEVFA